MEWCDNNYKMVWYGMMWYTIHSIIHAAASVVKNTLISSINGLENTKIVQLYTHMYAFVLTIAIL